MVSNHGGNCPSATVKTYRLQLLADKDDDSDEGKDADLDDIIEAERERLRQPTVGTQLHDRLLTNVFSS